MYTDPAGGGHQVFSIGSTEGLNITGIPNIAQTCDVSPQQNRSNLRRAIDSILASVIAIHMD